MPIEKIFQLCERHNFFSKTIKNGCLSLKIGSVGALLERNLKNEWFISNTIDRILPVFFNKNSFSDTFNYANQMCLNTLPFGITEIVTQKNNNDNKNKFENFCVDGKFIVLKNTTFVAPSESQERFSEWQRLRKTWWRKFSSSPGKFVLSDISNDSNGSQIVEVCGNYSWGKEVLETITLEESPKVKDTHTITSNVSLASMLLNSVCDAFDEPQFQGRKRPLLRFHRKIAPYKLSFAIGTNQNVNVKSDANSKPSTELEELTLYLSKLVKVKGISCLLLPIATKWNLEKQWNLYDELGVPYCIIVKDESLKNGVVYFRSRDTTLEEQVHVTKLQNYVVKLFENY